MTQLVDGSFCCPPTDKHFSSASGRNVFFNASSMRLCESSSSLMPAPAKPKAPALVEEKVESATTPAAADVVTKEPLEKKVEKQPVEVNTETQPSSVSTQTTSIPTTATPESETEAKLTRANNDPRLNPMPVKQAVITTESAPQFQGKPLDTSQPAAIEHSPRSLERPANDPRSRK